MDNRRLSIKTVSLAYFSGTGGTEKIVRCFKTQFLKAGINVNIVDISCCDSYHEVNNSELLIVFSPVYAFRLATIVERWVKNLPKTQDILAAVISVSGVGEISPNTACRVHCKRMLIKKGYHMIYEKMLVMPSNFATQAEYQMNLQLIKVMPHKVERIVSAILSNESNFTKPLLMDRFLAMIGKVEHFGAKIFGLSIRASKACSQCGLCARKCPMNNIRLQNGKIRSGSKCIWCLKCIYGCPSKALSPRILKFTVIKDGYNLKEMSEDAISLCDTEYKFSKNIFWKGVNDYLKED